MSKDYKDVYLETLDIFQNSVKEEMSEKYGDKWKQQTAFLLMNYEDKFGKEGIKDLWAVDKWFESQLPEERERAVKNTFIHDIFGQHEPCMLPRSNGYFEEYSTLVSAE